MGKRARSRKLKREWKQTCTDAFLLPGKLRARTSILRAVMCEKHRIREETPLINPVYHGGVQNQGATTQNYLFQKTGRSVRVIIVWILTTRIGNTPKGLKNYPNEKMVRRSFSLLHVPRSSACQYTEQ
jgi:hypothetical protein